MTAPKLSEAVVLCRTLQVSDFGQCLIDHCRLASFATRWGWRDPAYLVKAIVDHLDPSLDDPGLYPPQLDTDPIG